MICELLVWTLEYIILVAVCEILNKFFQGTDIYLKF